MNYIFQDPQFTAKLIKALLGFGPLICALIAGIVALRQARRNSITSARIKWLEDLKMLIAECIKIASAFLVFNQLLIAGDDTDGEFLEKHTTEFLGKIQEMIQALTQNVMLVSLNLNKSEFLSQTLLLKLTELIKLMNQIKDKELVAKATPLLEQIEVLGSAILKIEWETTKSQRIKYKSRADLKKYSTKVEAQALTYLTEEQKISINRFNQMFL